MGADVTNAPAVLEAALATAMLPLLVESGVRCDVTSTPAVLGVALATVGLVMVLIAPDMGVMDGSAVGAPITAGPGAAASAAAVSL